MKVKKKTKLLLGLLVVMAMSFLLASSANADVLAFDDFSSSGSGTGWAAGSSWTGGSLGASGYTVSWGGTSFRPFEASILDSNDPLYVGFDFTRSSDTWAGVSLFNGGSEELFMGHPFNQSFYGGEVSDPVQGSIYLGNVSIDTSAHRMVTQIDFGGGAGGQDRIRFWVDNSTEAAPDATVDVNGSWLPSQFTQLRLGTNGVLTVDNLTVSTDFSQAFVGTPEPATMSLLALGGLAMLKRRRRKA